MTGQPAGTSTTDTVFVPQYSKPVAAVIFEGTLVDENDEWKPDVWDKLERLRRTHCVTIVSHRADSLLGANTILQRLYASQIPFDDLFLGSCFPKHAVVICDTALPLT